jgi:hypothetical protein
MSNSVENDLAGVAAEKATILRMLQVEMSEQPEDKRVESLRGALDEMVTAMPPDRRRAFLNELSRMFPTWGKADAARPPPAAAAQPVAAAPPTPAALVEQLCAAAASMSVDGRAAVVRRLAAAGFPLPAGGGGNAAPAAVADAAGGPSVEPILGPLRTLLQIPPGQPLDLARVGQVVTQVVELTLLSDPVAWGMWQQRVVTGNTPIVCRGRVRDEVRAWLTAPADGRGDRTRAVLADLRRLIASMVCTLAEMPPQVDTAVRERFDPSQVEQAIAIEGFRLTGPIGANRKDTECWRRFVEAYKAVSAAGGFKNICQRLAVENVEMFFEGGGQPPAI